MEEAKFGAEIYAKIITVQVICIALIIAAVLFAKCFFAKTYLKAEKWYRQNICVSTDAREVMEEDYEL